VILLDTNVVSEMMATEPHAAVVAWLDRQPSESVWTTAVTVFEIRTGLELLPDGRRRRRLEDAFQQTLTEDFEHRVLPFDEMAASIGGRFAAEQRRAGRPTEIRDVQIAAIAAARRATLATRNTRHFEVFGIPLVDPWS
jgi:predicted nucleic acid-binding protein